MRKLITLALLIVPCTVGTIFVSIYNYQPNDWNLFVEALIQQESSGNPTAVGDNGKAVGCLQFWPIMVAEANRVSNGHYTLEDRLSRTKSIEMFNAIQDYHNPEHDFVKALKIWNPTAGEWYTNQVLSTYNKLYNERYSTPVIIIRSHK